jgi:hypothetical protein
MIQTTHHPAELGGDSEKPPLPSAKFVLLYFNDRDLV